MFTVGKFIDTGSRLVFLEMGKGGGGISLGWCKCKTDCGESYVTVKLLKTNELQILAKLMVY